MAEQSKTVDSALALLTLVAQDDGAPKRGGAGPCPPPVAHGGVPGCWPRSRRTVSSAATTAGGACPGLLALAAGIDPACAAWRTPSWSSSRRASTRPRC